MKENEILEERTVIHTSSFDIGIIEFRISWKITASFFTLEFLTKIKNLYFAIFYIFNVPFLWN